MSCLIDIFVEGNDVTLFVEVFILFVFLFYNNDLATVDIVLYTQIVLLFEHILELGYLCFSSNMDFLCTYSNMITMLCSSNISILSFDTLSLPQ